MTSMLEQHWYIDIFRLIMSGLDSVIYKILAGLYNVFFNIADATILQPEMIKALFGRVQLILGIIILFKLVISFFTGIVNPEGFSDEKKGFGGVLKRIVVTLVMLLMLVPLNIPAADLGDSGMGSWNKNMNNHGILFGSMYELQKRVLKGNVIMNLVMGDQFENEEMSKTSQAYGEKFATDVLRVFLTVNVAHDGDNFNDKCKGNNTKCVCKYAADEDAFDIYFNSSSNVDQLLDSKVVKAWCSGNVSDEAKKAGFTYDYYAFAYSSIWSTIVGVLFCILILSLAMDMAIRVFKLAILEIVAPIPIVSYIDPGSEKVFKSWTKMLMDTYLSVFIRIAIISFILFVLSSFSNGGIQIANSSGSVGFVSKILIYLGLIFFAREAPKFITKTLGIEGEGTGLLDGFNKLRAAKAATGGIVSGAVSKFSASKGQNKGKRVAALLSGAVGGTVNAGGQLLRGGDVHAVRDANRRYAAQNYERAEDNSTFFGRRKAALQQGLGLKTDVQRMDDQIKHFEAANTAMQRISNAFDGNGAYKFTLDDNFQDIVDSNGNVIMNRKNADGSYRKYTLKEMKDILNRVNASGDENLIRQVDAAMKKYQGERLTHLRTLKREDLVKLVNDRNTDYTESDLIAYDGAHRIYDVAKLYKDEAMFSPFYDDNDNLYAFNATGKDKNGINILDWGAAFKFSAGQSGKKSESIKNSDEYFKAKSNTKRAEQQNNKNS